MSTANDRTRRLIADFFAARLEPRRSEIATPPTLHDDAEPMPLPHAERDSSRQADLGDPVGAEVPEID